MIDISVNIHIYISLIIAHHHHPLANGLLRETQVFGDALTFEVDKGAAWGHGSRAVPSSRTFHSDETVLKEASSHRSFQLPELLVVTFFAPIS